VTGGAPAVDPAAGERVVLEVDEGTRAADRLRSVAGAVVGGLSVVLVAVAGLGDPRVVLCAGIGFVFALGWGATALRRRRPERWRLILDREGLDLRMGRTERRVRWAEVAQVGVDEERLVVRIELVGDRAPAHARDVVVVPPIFGGLGVYELADRVAATRDRAPARNPNRD